MAADFRPHGDGKRRAILKLVAGMLGSGVGVDELVRAIDPALDDKMKAQLARSVELAQQTPAPFDQALIDDADWIEHD